MNAVALLLLLLSALPAGQARAAAHVPAAEAVHEVAPGDRLAADTDGTDGAEEAVPLAPARAHSAVREPLTGGALRGTSHRPPPEALPPEA